jgi:hypothetical protein
MFELTSFFVSNRAEWLRHQYSLNAMTLQQSFEGAQRISSVELSGSFFDDSRRRIEQMEEQYNGDHFVAKT